VKSGLAASFRLCILDIVCPCHVHLRCSLCAPWLKVTWSSTHGQDIVDFKRTHYRVEPERNGLLGGSPGWCYSLLAMLSGLLKLFWLPILFLYLPGCALYQAKEVERAVDHGIAEFHSRSTKVKLGDSKEKVLMTLQPTQEGVPASYRRPSETFMADSRSAGKSIVEIHYFRSARIPDGLNTDDEFTPYVFRDGSLEAIGWTSLGGAKNVAKPSQTTQTTVIRSPAPKPTTCYHFGSMTQCD